MRRVPSVGFSLDATEPVPNRTLSRQASREPEPVSPSGQPPVRSNVLLAEFLEAQSAELRVLILALAAAFQEVGGRLRYGLRMPSGLDASVDAHRVEAAGDVGRLALALASALALALALAVALSRTRYTEPELYATISSMCAMLPDHGVVRKEMVRRGFLAHHLRTISAPSPHHLLAHHLLAHHLFASISSHRCAAASCTLPRSSSTPTRRPRPTTQ